MKDYPICHCGVGLVDDVERMWGVCERCLIYIAGKDNLRRILRSEEAAAGIPPELSAKWEATLARFGL